MFFCNNTLLKSMPFSPMSFRGKQFERCEMHLFFKQEKNVFRLHLASEKAVHANIHFQLITTTF